MPTETVTGMPVLTLDINETGQVKRRLPRLAQAEQLKNTLLEGLYPGIRVARLNVPPGRLEDFQEALVENSMKSVEMDGVRYRLIGASASAKSGKFYAVDENGASVLFFSLPWMIWTNWQASSRPKPTTPRIRFCRSG